VKPLLDEALAEDARRALDGLSTALMNVDPATLIEPSWASGTSGHALVHAQLAQVFPDRGHDERAQHYLDRTLDWVAEHQIQPWLIGGLAGIGWVVERVAGNEDPDAHDPNAALDMSFLRLVESPKELQWELMYGVAGLAVYGLSRRTRSAARRLLEGVARRLVASASATPRRWLSKPEWDQYTRHAGPDSNFGFGHGIPGTLAVVAELVAEDVLADELRPLLKETSEWLASERLRETEDAWFRCASDDHAEPARTAWCYGDPGVAWALMLAARSLGDHALGREALAIASHAAQRPFERTGVVDAGLCHGAAGLGHLFHRMSLLTPDAPALADAAREWFGRALFMRLADAPLAGYKAYVPTLAEPGAPFAWKDDPGLLTGAAGVALALASALGEAHGWDAPMMVSARDA
jgi:lantibiotic modifying enzyme